MEKVPENEEEATEWLHELFREKDKIIDSFHSTGSFFKTSGVKEVPYKMYSGRLCSLINFVVWAFISVSMVLYYLISSLLAQNWLGLSIAIGILTTCTYLYTYKMERITNLKIMYYFLCFILFAVYLFMVKAINMSKISKASTYGADVKMGTN